MNSTLTALYASVDLSALFAATLAIVGIAVSGLRFLSKRSVSRKSTRALFPPVKSSKVTLQGPEKCSLDGNVFVASHQLVNGDFVYDFPDLGVYQGQGQHQSQYQSQGQYQRQASHNQSQASHSQSHNQRQASQNRNRRQNRNRNQVQYHTLNNCPPAHAPKRRAAQPLEYHYTPYYNPKKQAHPNGVQIFSPTLSSRDQRLLEYVPEPVPEPVVLEPYTANEQNAYDLWTQSGYINKPIEVPAQDQYLQDPLVAKRQAQYYPVQTQTNHNQGQNIQNHAQEYPQEFIGHAQIPTPVSSDAYTPVTQPAVAAHAPAHAPAHPAPAAPAPIVIPSAPAAPAPQAAPQLDTDDLGFPLFDDVLDVVYDTDFSFAAIQSNNEILSHTSSDHSDQELWFSPPPNSQQPLSYSPDEVSPEADSSASGSPEQHDRFVCPECGAGFRIKGYLTRHLKKHAQDKAYTCPFYSPDKGHKCHPTGGFSRRDTYKTHLKARHFIYPPNTPCNRRAQVVGTCSGCQRTFSSNETWVESHIQTKECPILSN